MKQLINLGRLLYGIGLIALGVHQLLLQNFRPEIMPPFPFLDNKYQFVPIIFGLVLIFAGVAIAGFVKITFITPRRICLYLGLCFLVLTVIFQLPYILFVSPVQIFRLDVWFGAGETLAYCGGAFVIAGSYPENAGPKNFLELFSNRLIPCGRIFFSVLMILFGISHFTFPAFVSTMVPKWIGAPMFWTYFCGVALISAGLAIILKIWIRTVALLLALMLFIFFLCFHVPDAIANPSEGKGNEIVRAIIALLFTGISLVIAETNGSWGKVKV